MAGVAGAPLLLLLPLLEKEKVEGVAIGKEGMPWAEVMTGVTTGIVAVAAAVEGEAIMPIDVEAREGVREVMVVAAVVEGWKSGDEGWRDCGVYEMVC